MNTYQRSLDIVVKRIMKEDAQGRREPDPRLLRALKRLIRMSPTKAESAAGCLRQDDVKGVSRERRQSPSTTIATTRSRVS